MVVRQGGKTMTIQIAEPIKTGQLDEYIVEAASAAHYENGFGIQDCDLSKPIWWAGYCRQSLDQQTQNNRLPEYLLTLAKMAKEQGVVIPREYVFYDHETGEHLERHSMAYLRYELAHKKLILGILFADIRCLSREPAPQQVFERECELLGVKLMFGDAPGGMDLGSQFARSAITFSNKMARLATHRNARAGNIGRILKGSVPACKAAYGYRYRRDAEIANGRIYVKKAWWDIDELDLDGLPVENTSAWVVTQIFRWIGLEGRSSFWVAKKLNEMGIKAPAGGIWGPNRVCKLVHRRCYTGKNFYNSSCYVPNPERPLGDVTAQIRRTISRPKPEDEWVPFNVPLLVSEELWQKGNVALTQRGRGKGKEGKSIQALLRNRIFCPRCGKPMVVRRDGKQNRVYYHCSRHYRPWDTNACSYHRFVPGSWDEAVWDFVCAVLSDSSWIENQLEVEQNKKIASAKLLEVELRKITQIQAKIAKVQEGFEAGIYSTEEAKSRIASYQKAVSGAEQEIKHLQQPSTDGLNSADIENLRKDLKAFAEKKLDGATFQEKQNVISKLNIRVYPSEDLKTIRVRCGVNFVSEGNDHIQCGKIIFAPPSL
jgi:site-specific DNA recombinase